jgi:hypothetical protein
VATRLILEAAAVQGGKLMAATVAVATAAIVSNVTAFQGMELGGIFVNEEIGITQFNFTSYSWEENTSGLFAR